MPFNAQHRSIRNLMVSANKQNAYGTALADGALTHRPLMPADAFAQISKQFFHDANFANKGHDFPTKHQEIERSTAFGWNGVVADFMAGWLSAFALGAVTTTGAGPYTHTCKFLQASRQMPVTTVYSLETADIGTKWLDLAIAELRISGARSGPLSYSVSLIGSGKFTDGVVAPPAVPAMTLLLGSDTDILLGAQGAAASIKERIEAWEVRILTELDVHRAPGGALIGTMTKIGRQSAAVNLAISAKDVDDIRTLFINDTKRELQINTNSGAAAQLNIKFPALYFSQAPYRLSGNWITLGAEADESSVIKDGANEPIEMVAINSQATFLVGA